MQGVKNQFVKKSCHLQCSEVISYFYRTLMMFYIKYRLAMQKYFQVPNRV